MPLHQIFRLCIAVGLSAVAGTSLAIAANDDNSSAVVNIDTASLIQQARRQQLHKSRTWNQLLHYEDSDRSPTGIESQVDDVRFFNAADGKTNPLAELEATIGAIFTPFQQADVADKTVSLQEAHPRCRFVSREDWLRKQLNLPPEDVPTFCTLYFEWRKAVGSHTMSLVFPASYLNSPSSMFGHTLLRLDPENIDQGSDWLSWSLNFAADTGDENFSAGYAFKGIAGGYTGKFNSVPYFTKLQEYGAIENRDIWEYQLNFTPIELDRMLDHAWELRDISFDYYFFRQNCSYRLLELMDYARPSLRLTEQFKLTTIPADTIKAVARSGIVTDTHYRASLGTGIQARYSNLPKALRHWVTDISNNPAVANSETFKSLDPGSQASILRLANDFLTYRSRRTSRTKEMAEKRLELLKLISILPVEEFEPATPIAPETAHDTRLLNLSFGRQFNENFVDAGFRWSYHDILDRNAGYLRGAGISLANVVLRQYESGKTNLESVELVKLQSISDRALIFNSLSWNLSAGFSRDPYRNGNDLAGVLSGSIGKSTAVLENTIGYGLLGASVSQYDKLEDNFVDARVQFGLLHYHRNFAAQVDVELEAPQDESLRATVSLQTNVPLSKNQALRFTLSQARVQASNESVASVQYRFYF